MYCKSYIEKEILMIFINLRKHVSKKLKTIRISKGYSICKLAQTSNVSKCTIYNIEKAKLNTKLSTLEKLAKTLNCKVKDFF